MKMYLFDTKNFKKNFTLTSQCTRKIDIAFADNFYK